jgi:chromosome segregation ATPase
LIEAIMLAAVGFLTACVLWLVMLPAIGRRADRLARRRAELTFPMSVEEIAAERDHLRAQFAVRQRELERRAEESLAARAAAMKAAGALDLAISELKTTLGVRDVRIADLEMNLAATRTELSQTEAALAAERAGHEATRGDLAIRGVALAERERELAALSAERTDLTVALKAKSREFEAASAEIAVLTPRLEGTTSALARLERDHAALMDRAAALGADLSASQALAAAQAQTIGGLEQALSGTRRQLEEEQGAHFAMQAAFDRRGAEIAGVVAERESLRARLRHVEDMEIQLDQALKAARVDNGLLEGQLAAARKDLASLEAQARSLGAERARLQAEAASARHESEVRLAALRADLEAERKASAALASEVQALSRDARASAQRVEAENAALREAITRAADQFLAGRQPSGPSLSGLTAKGAGLEPLRAERALHAIGVAGSTSEAPHRAKRAARKRTAGPVPDRAAE